MNQQILDYLQSNDRSLNRIGVTLLLQEGEESAAECLKYLRDKAWDGSIRYERAHDTYMNTWDLIELQGYSISCWEQDRMEIKKTFRRTLQ